jgi:hypothetical protein
MKTQILKIKDIIQDKELYPRINHNWITVYDYSQSIKAGAKFPPITVALFNNKYYLIDGKHRIEAIKVLKIKYIKAEIIKGLSKKQIYEEAVKRNVIHGRVFSPYEKRNIILRLREMKYDMKLISKIIMIPPESLEKFTYKKITSHYTTGDPIVVKAPLENITETGYEGDIETLQRIINVGDQINLLKQVNLFFENKFFDMKNQTVVIELKKLKKLIREFKS